MSPYVPGSQRLSRAQFFWAVAGLAVLILVITLAKANFMNIYEREPSFVLGSLLTFTGFSFARACSKTSVNAAVEMIREDARPEVVDALDERMIGRLHAKGVPTNVAVVKRNIIAAGKRAAEFYDLQAKDPRFAVNAPMFRVILDDLDEVLAGVVHLEKAVDSPEAQPTYLLPVDARSALFDALRDMREAVHRRNETYEALVPQLETPRIDDLWGAFAVLTSDTLKALRDIEALMSRCLVFPPSGRLVTLTGYVEAAIQRALEVEALVQNRELQPPHALKTMISDLTNARNTLRRVDLDGSGPRLGDEQPDAGPARTARPRTAPDI